MIYDRFGGEVTIVRMGTLEDVKTLDKRRPDKQDRTAIANGSYVVVRHKDGREVLAHQAYLRATDGSLEIGKAIDALGKGAEGTG
jgi:hypothetical protein